MRLFVAVELTIVPAPLPPRSWYTVPVLAPTAQKPVPSALATPRMAFALKLVVVVVVSIAPESDTRPSTRAIVVVAVPEGAAVPTAAS